MEPNLESININYWVLQTIAMAITALLIPKLRITSPFGALATVVALAFVNAHVWDAALFFSIPDHFSAHALTLVLANGALFWVLVKVLPGIEVSGILPALAAPLVFTVVSLAINQYGKDVDWIALGKRGVAEIQAYRNDLKSGHAAESAPPRAENPSSP